MPTQPHLGRRAGRPQLKREPLGGAWRKNSRSVEDTTLRSLLPIIAVSVSFFSSHAQKQSPSPVIGRWRLIAVEAHDDAGSVSYIFGRHPRGQVMYDAAGNVYVLLFDPGRPPFASGDRLRGTSQEIQAAFEGSVAYYGRYTVDPAVGRVTHHVLGSTFPNWIGTDLVRYFKIDGQRLSLTTAPFVQGGKRITALNIFERIE
jgi:hypothetical protein